MSRLTRYETSALDYLWDTIFFHAIKFIEADEFRFPFSYDETGEIAGVAADAAKLKAHCYLTEED
ncbi:hypothetical protein LCGC14_0344390 [marine sediment metagenome]|uniref:Uncharacterized protein n=1 Tax=marine sediment metagenome TaxID=412755 RepID=A0A0F9WKF3_9ZZZZ